MLEHGGRLRAAAKRFGIPEAEWLDLSTGLNPHGWPVPDVPARVWQRLPEDNDGLETAACEYYGCEQLLPMAGSQAAIQLLPQLRPKGLVGVLAPTYAEHPYHWRLNGHEVMELTLEQAEQRLHDVDVMVVINPNNPTAQVLGVEQLTRWHQTLANRGGWLVIDEAFMDVTPEGSMVSHAGKPGLIVLRSLGKFFGLAGVRLGCVVAEPALLDQLAEAQGPWAVSGPTRYVAQQALRDRHWQVQMRLRLKQESERLAALLRQAGFEQVAGTALFQWLLSEQANTIYNSLAERGILVRRFERPASLRFGLPESESDWQRLEQALQNLP